MAETCIFLQAKKLVKINPDVNIYVRTTTNDQSNNSHACFKERYLLYQQA